MCRASFWSFAWASASAGDIQRAGGSFATCRSGRGAVKEVGTVALLGAFPHSGAFVLGQVFHKVAPIDKRSFKPARDADAAINNAEDEAARECDEHDVLENFHDEDEHGARLCGGYHLVKRHIAAGGCFGLLGRGVFGVDRLARGVAVADVACEQRRQQNGGTEHGCGGQKRTGDAHDAACGHVLHGGVDVDVIIDTADAALREAQHEVNGRENEGDGLENQIGAVGEDRAQERHGEHGKIRIAGVVKQRIAFAVQAAVKPHEADEQRDDGHENGIEQEAGEYRDADACENIEKDAAQAFYCEPAECDGGENQKSPQDVLQDDVFCHALRDKI